MKFFSKEICKKLDAAGLKSDSEFFYVSGDPMPHHSILHATEHYNDIPAFTLLDFLSTEEYAKENCAKIFGFDKFWPDNPESKWVKARHAIIDSPDGIEYVSKIVEIL